MSKRTTIFANGEIYHIYNRGVEKRLIFTSPKEFKRFFDLLRFYQRHQNKRFSALTGEERESIIASKKGELLVEIICYCLMPNHFHILLRQTSDQGIQRFIKIISDGYSKYFNLKHDRVGSLFQGNFKAVRIENDNQLLHVNRYIHLNPVTAYLVDHPKEYMWSSYNEYLGNVSIFCLKELVLGRFKNSKKYEQFILDQKDYARRLGTIEHLALEKEP